MEFMFLSMSQKMLIKLLQKSFWLQSSNFKAKVGIFIFSTKQRSIWNEGMDWQFDCTKQHRRNRWSLIFKKLMVNTGLPSWKRTTFRKVTNLFNVFKTTAFFCIPKSLHFPHTKQQFIESHLSSINFHNSFLELLGSTSGRKVYISKCMHTIAELEKY